MTALTRDQILAVNDLPREEVPVPIWGNGASVFIKTMSAAERDRCFILARKPNSEDLDPQHFRTKLLVFCLCDELGQRLFDDHEYELLGAKCGQAIASLYAAAQRLNGMGDTQAVIEDARKNS